MVRENDRQKFVSLANSRVNRALKDIQLIGNLSNRSNYDYTIEDVNKIFKALNKAIQDCKNRFDETKKSHESKFEIK